VNFKAVFQTSSSSLPSMTGAMGALDATSVSEADREMQKKAAGIRLTGKIHLLKIMFFLLSTQRKQQKFSLDKERAQVTLRYYSVYANANVGKSRN
jgi:hypothetical protein